MRIEIINGPNLNLQGKRQPDIYGTETFESLVRRIQEENMSCEFGYFQSNHEGALIDRLHASTADGIVLNAGAFSHYSYAIADAIRAINVPVIEVHLSNIHAREAFRDHSVLSAACVGTIAGFGMLSYEMAVDYFLQKSGKKK